MNLKNYLNKNPKLKKRIHRFIMHPVKTRPYWWIRILQPIYIKKGKGAVIYRSVRKDLPPFHQFRLGKYSVIEDYSCLNKSSFYYSLCHTYSLKLCISSCWLLHFMDNLFSSGYCCYHSGI